MMIQYIYMYFYVLVLHRVQVCISITNRPPSTLATDGHRDLNQFAAERLLLAVKGVVVVVQPPLKTQKSNSDRRHYKQVYTLIALLLLLPPDIVQSTDTRKHYKLRQVHLPLD